jgi:hypothetical protein
MRLRMDDGTGRESRFLGPDLDPRRVTAGSQIPGTRRLYEDTDGHRGAAI